MKTGYPFLAISKKYNLEYADVLKAADLNRCMGRFEGGYGPRTAEAQEIWNDLPRDVCLDIIDANRSMFEMQAGLRSFDEGHVVS